MSVINAFAGTAGSYDIMIEPGLAARAPAIIEQVLGERRLFVVADKNAARHAAALSAKAERTIILEPGEASKSWNSLSRTVEAMLESKVDRKSLVVAVGGGVAGDHAGFAAAIALRGLDYVQIPTTLLAQVDSSVGGKTGINTGQGKNLVGAFHQPKLVLIDPETLATLPEREMRAGYAEVVKYAFIRDGAFLGWLERNGQDLLAKDAASLETAITRSVQAKADIVAEDEHETKDIRALLNFGHTFAHAFEAACQYDRRLLHGEAVAIGMACAFDLSCRMGLCPQADAARATDHMRAVGLPVALGSVERFPKTTAAALVDAMAGDKKAAGGKLRMILTRGIGHAFVTGDIDMAALNAVLNEQLG